jgi:hypothetical protein
MAIPQPLIRFMFSVWGAILSGIGIALIIRQVGFARRAHHVEGDVTRINMDKGRSLLSSARFEVIITYRTAPGKRLTLREGPFLNWPPYTEHQRVKVLFDPDDPAHAQVRPYRVWIASLAIVLVGVAHLLYGFLG